MRAMVFEIGHARLRGLGGRLRVGTSSFTGARKVGAMTVASLFVLAGALALGTPALAADTHNYLFQFNEVPAEGPLHEHIRVPGPMSGGNVVLTVDSGEVYVAEGFNEVEERVDKFNATTGAFIAQFDQTPSILDLHVGIAVGHASGEGEVYVGADEYTGGYHGAVAVFSAAGHLKKVWKGAVTPSKAFGCFECSGSGGVAVDNSPSIGDWAAGDVYVADPENKVVDVFKDESGAGEEYVTQLTGVSPGEPFTNPRQVAVNETNGDVIIVDGEAVDIFKPAALAGQYEFVGKVMAPNAAALEPQRLDANDGEGDIYIDYSEKAGSNDEVLEFSPTGAYLGKLSAETAPGGSFGEGARGPVAVASDPTTRGLFALIEASPDSVYAFGPNIVIPDVTTEAPSSIKSESATLNGTVNPDGAGEASCQFDWGTTASFGNVAPCTEAVKDGVTPVAEHVALTLEPDTTYHYRLQASNAKGNNLGEAWEDQEFTTPGPGIHGESATTVTSVSASLQATINPHNTPTSYYFRYGTDTSYGTDVPALPGVELGSGEGDQPVSVHIQGLSPNTTYHYRVVTVSEPGGEPLTYEGPDETFTTQAPGTSVALPDGRAWEMVTPPNKYGSGINAIGNEQGGPLQAAANGDGIVFGATAPFVPNPAGSRSLEVTQVISTRSAPGSWETHDITTPHNEGATSLLLGNSAEYKLFSSDLSLGLVEPAGSWPLPPLPAGSEKTPYLRTAGGEYTPLLTSANVSPGVKFGITTPGNVLGEAEYVDANQDLSDVILTSGVPLAPGPSYTGHGLYEWAQGQLQLVSVLPKGEATAAVLGRKGGWGIGDVRHAISEDGARVVFEVGELDYLRDTTRKETVRIDAAQGVPAPGNAKSIYRTANSEDSRVFFTDASRLTGNSTANESSHAEDLYVFEVTSGDGEPLAGKLTDLTVDGNAGGDESANVQGVIGASEDGSYVYFVAGGVLGEGAAHGAEAGGDNLYAAHYDVTTKTWTSPTFIALLAGADRPDWHEEGEGNLNQMTSRVSPNGRYLTFMSERSLTGYENRDASSGVPDEEVFLYDADAGKVVCASCDPTGARPAGLLEGNLYEENLVDYAKTWNGRWISGNIPGWTPTSLQSSLDQSRYLSSSGRLFFNSDDALVPADVNGKEDVYEYEPVGEGSCQPPTYGQSASDVFSESIDGCVALISAGTSSEESAFIEASESGGDVFFLTQSRLSPADYDTSDDIYDAHECLTSAPCAPAPPLTPPPCDTGDACKPAPTPQPTLFGTPSSETFSGAGNIVPSAPTKASAKAPMTKSLTRQQKLAKALKACGKKPKRKRPVCERQARKKYGAKQARAGKSVASRTRR
jgi:hypothetical protein